MEINIPNNLMYSIDRGVYDKKIATSNLSFMLSQHFDDTNADFLDSELFQQLHEECVLANIKKWCREISVIEILLGKNVALSSYAIDNETGKLMVRFKDEI